MSLDDKVNDKQSEGFMKKALKLGWKIGMAAATTALSTSYVGITGVAVGGALAAAESIGNLIKGKSLYETVSEALTAYSAVNSVIAPIVSLGDATFHLIDNSTLLGKAARTIYATTAYNAAFVASYNAAAHLIDNPLNPQGMAKSISGNFYNQWKRVGLGFLPGYALVANEVPLFGGISHFAWNALPWGIYNKVNPLPDPKNIEYPQKQMPSITPQKQVPAMTPAPAT